MLPQTINKRFNQSTPIFFKELFLGGNDIPPIVLLRLMNGHFLDSKAMKSALKLLAIILLFITQVAQAQIPDNVKSYAVIGVFKLESNAQRFADYYASKSLDAKVRENKFNKLHYVYTIETLDVEEARSMVLSIREKFSSLNKAWLYNGNFNCLHIPSDQLKKSSDFGMEKIVHDVEEAETQREQNQAKEVQPKMEMPKEDVVTEEMVAKEEPREEKPEGKYWVYFNTYNETDLHEVTGHVKLTDLERGKELGRYPTQELVTLDDPKNGTRRVKFESDIFGYRVEEREVDLDEPSKSKSLSELTLVGDSIIINFPLKRYNKGDYMTMWNVYFYIDAAIMKEESIPELNQLLDLLKENESIKIMIHGHTNGNSHGPVKHLDLDDKSFFSLKGNHLETNSSAKKLSEYRAFTIQQWLTDQGISEDRMEIKGWGGKKMIYDKHSNQAEKNVRVEIEILEE